MTLEEYAVEKLKAKEEQVDRLKEKCKTREGRIDRLEQTLAALAHNAEVKSMDDGKGIYISFDGVWKDTNPVDFVAVMEWAKEYGLIKEDK